MSVGTMTGCVLPGGFPFQLSPKEITYLGIRIGPSLNKLVKLNLKPIITRIRDDLHKWEPVSWLNRISVLKMYILYYPDYCTLYRGCQAQFILQGKKVRMRIGKLQRGKEQGGLGVPCMRSYCSVAQLRYI